MDILYVYAVGRVGQQPPAGLEAVDGSSRIDCFDEGPLCAFFTRVDGEEFSQEGVDRRAGDLEWLGAIGYRHQAATAALMRSGAIIPLRAFTLFSNDAALREWLRSDREQLLHTLERLDGKQEWTLRIEFDPERWSAALVARVAPLRALSEEMEASTAGKAFLLRKKLEEERKK